MGRYRLAVAPTLAGPKERVRVQRLVGRDGYYRGGGAPAIESPDTFLEKVRPPYGILWHLLGAEPLGVAAILGQHPHHRLRHLKKSPAPLFHAISQTVRRELYEGYAWFVAAFRQAAEKLKAGDRSAAFPTGSFPPALPFVGG
jgi:hypothetical protein